MLQIYGYDFECYNIDSNFMPIFNRMIDKNEYLYIVNYFGQLNKTRVVYLKQKYCQIILDNAHAFFQKPISGIDTIYTCRKFFGVPDGAYLSTEVKIKNDLEIDISKDRMAHVLGRYEGMASDYYKKFQNSDESFKNEPLKYMSNLTHNILGAIDYERVRQIRNENYAYLESKLGSYNKLHLITPNGAFAYPFYMENGIEIRKALAKKKIYIPTLWPNVINEMLQDTLEYNYAANILPLPCDQRYIVEDMVKMVEEIEKCIN